MVEEANTVVVLLVLVAVYMLPQLIYFFVIDKSGVLLVSSKFFTNW